jgi:hypothetical protein
MKLLRPKFPAQADADSILISSRLRHAMAIASLQEADALLRKWNISESQIVCTSVSRGVAFRLRGVVVEANQEGFAIANSSDANLIVKFFRVREFQIKRAGEGHQAVSTLHLSLHDGVEITLNEESKK